MYDVLFKCRQCGVHLSAGADDAGYEFLCPECDNILQVPAGDILFDCAGCRTSLLAPADSEGSEFTCPSCGRSVVVPQEGKAVAVARALIVDEPVPAPPIPQPSASESPQPEAVVIPGDSQRTHDQFMSTWGAYMATAGLVKEGEKIEGGESAEMKDANGS